MVFLFLPNRQALKQIASVLIGNGEKAFHHVQIKCFSETAWTGDQSNSIFVFPPFTDKISLIYKKAVVFSNVCKILCTQGYGLSHA